MLIKKQLGCSSTFYRQPVKQVKISLVNGYNFAFEMSFHNLKIKIFKHSQLTLH